MKGLFLGTLLIIVVGIGGLVYRNAIEHTLQPIVCPQGTLLCPDGTSVARTGNSCTFPVCPPPNVSLPEIGISFALPSGFTAMTLPDAASVAAYTMSANASSTNDANIIIRQYAISASSTALSIMQQTAIQQVSGLPAPVTSFTSTGLGTHRFTVVTLDRVGGTVDTAYYFARGTDVLRFDAIDMNVTNWNDPYLDTSTLPAHAALVRLLGTLQGQ